MRLLWRSIIIITRPNQVFLFSAIHIVERALIRGWVSNSCHKSHSKNTLGRKMVINYFYSYKLSIEHVLDFFRGKLRAWNSQVKKYICSIFLKNPFCWSMMMKWLQQFKIWPLSFAIGLHCSHYSNPLACQLSLNFNFSL